LVPIGSESEGEGIKAQLIKLGWQPAPGRSTSCALVFSDQYIKATPSGNVVLDLFLVLPGIWGNALLFTTGPKSFNDKIREDILGLGYTWYNPRCFTNMKSKVDISFATERAALDFLNIGWIPPRKRS
jgi:DNA polymerase/3'-5' exonuclease PolX